MIFQTKKPINFSDMCDDLLKIIRIVDNSYTVEHIETSKRMLGNFTRKWKLNPTASQSPLYVSISERITNKLNQIVEQDLSNVHKTAKILPAQT